MKTLPDFLRPGLEIVSIGLNPSLPSVRAGFYFANPRNRFWPALTASRLAPAGLTPGKVAVEQLYRDASIGFTDLVKRPTAGASDLRAADYRAAAPLLQDRIAACAPAIAWFHGKVAYRHYLRYSGAQQDSCEWGLQPLLVANARVFVTPNPSPANAVYSLADLVHWFNGLADFRDSLRGTA